MNVYLGKLKFSYRSTKCIGHDYFISLAYQKFSYLILAFYAVFSSSRLWFIARVTKLATWQTLAPVAIFYHQNTDSLVILLRAFGLPIHRKNLEKDCGGQSTTFQNPMARVFFFLLILVAFIYKLIHEHGKLFTPKLYKEKCPPPSPSTSQSHTPKTTIVNVLGRFYTAGFEEKVEELQSDSTTVNQ